METVTLESLKPELSFKGDLLIDKTFILLPHTAEVTQELIQALQEWEFQTIYTEGSLSLGGDIGVNRTEQVQLYDDEDVETTDFNNPNSSATRIGESVKKAVEEAKTNSSKINNETSRIEMTQSIYDEYMNYIEQVFTHYATHKEINQDELAETVQDLCVFIKENRRFILRVNQSLETFSRTFLVRHTMRTSVIAIVIALQLKMPLSKMVDLGVSCFLHEIGMLRLSPSIYMTDKKLTPGERFQILKHPLLGYNIAKELNFPLPIQLGILEHHEKENATGYPRKLSSEKISINAKIISVACSYEAITAARSYKDAQSEFEAMVEMIQNQDHAYDSSIIRALLYSFSLYPIGSYVYLSDKKVALVVDTNPNNPKYPIVQSLTEKDANGFPKTITTDPNGTYIVRILSKSEQADMLKILEERNKTLSPTNTSAQEEVKDIEQVDNLKETSKVQEEEPSPQEEPKSAENSSPISAPDANGMQEVDLDMFS